MAKLNLNLTDYATQSMGADLIPAGSYHVKVTSTELIANQMDNSKARLVIWKEVVSGQHAGSVIKDSLNVLNPNADAERISREALKTYLTVTGCPNPNACEDSDILVGKELIVKIDIKPSSFKDRQTGEMKTVDQNNVKKRLEFTGTAPADAMPTAATDTPTKSAIADNGAAVFGQANTMMNPTTAAAPAAGKNPWDK